MKNYIYYLPGTGGRLTSGLGEGLVKRGLKIAGRETVGQFRSLGFKKQIEAICNDLMNYFWSSESRVIAVSYGAYLFLHAQAQMPPFPGKVLLLSPIIGQFSGEEIPIGFVPPKARLLTQLSMEGGFNPPRECQIHVGENDWQSNPDAVSAFGSRVGIDVQVVPALGHKLGITYVGDLLGDWLAEDL